MSRFRDFLRWYKNKDVVPTSEAMQNLITFNHDKDSDLLKLGCTLTNLPNICPHKSTDAIFYPFTENIRICWRRSEKMLLVVLLSFLHAKQLLMKPLLGNQGIFTGPKLELMLVNFTQTQCAKPCRLDCTRTGIWIQKPVDSHFDKTKPVASKIWSYFSFSDRDLNVKLKVFIQVADRRKLTVFLWMDFVHTAIQYLKLRVAFIVFALPRSASIAH